ncbi:MAG: hypothetical protein ACE5F5_01770 [Acidimicrobiia bacterium]
MPRPVQVRRLPLRTAGALGLASAGVYVIVLLGQESVPLLALFWLVVMGGAGILAWTASGSPDRGRVMARIAAAGFFLVGLFSNPFFAVVFLVAVVLCVVGSARLDRSAGPANTPG